jgi:hypothetical protein
MVADGVCVERYLLALRCLTAAQALDKTNPKVQDQASRFQSTVKPVLNTLPPHAQTIIKESLAV